MTTLIDSGELYRSYHELEGNAARLGRHLWLDARSLAYMVENDVAAMAGTLSSKAWGRHSPILDQGQLGSCTGNAGTGDLGTSPLWEAAGHAFTLDEGYAVKLYEDATVADGYPGTYPPDDTGSSGLAVCKVLKARGLVTGYRWARTPHGFLRLLQSGPVMMGLPWMQSFFDPDPQGFVDTAANWGQVAGGHEIEILEVEVDSADIFSSVLTFCNSWSSSWGDAGRGRMRLRTYERLSGCDLKQPVAA